METNTSQGSLYIAVLSFVIGLMVGVGGYRLIGDRVSNNDNFIIKDDQGIPKSADLEAGLSDFKQGSTVDVPKPPPLDLAKPDFIEKNQETIVVGVQAAGGKVNITSATLGKESWIVVHEEKNAVPANILGAQLFPAGTTSGAVELLRNTVTGQIYYAMVHNDDGDRKFDFTKDFPLRDTEGKIITAKFSTTN